MARTANDHVDRYTACPDEPVRRDVTGKEAGDVDSGAL
jgi:hypothetical protein